MARAMEISAPSSLSAGAAVTCWWCAPGRSRGCARLLSPVRSRLMTERRAAVGHRAAVEQLQRHRHRLRRHDVGDRDGIVELRAGMGAGVRAHQHRELGEVLFRHAILMHVPVSNKAVIGGNGRPQRHLVIGVPDLRQRLDRGIAALPGEAVLAGDHEHMPRDAGFDQVMREHGHRKPRARRQPARHGRKTGGCRSARRTRWPA